MSHATSGWSVVQIWLCLAAGRSDAALRRVERLRARVPGHPWALATHAYLLAQAGRRAEAIELLRQLTLVLEQATPGRRAVAWFNLGYLLEAEGREGEARVAFERATGDDPRLDRAWYGLGLVHLRAGRLEAAAGALEQCTRLQPMSPSAWYQLARLRAERGEADEARRLIAHLRGFEPRVAAQLVRETGLEAAPHG